MHRPRGFTMIELLVVVVLVAIVAAIAAPSFGNFILVQRLKSVNAQVVTDMQFARSEAAARNMRTRVRFGGDSAVTCYIIYTAPTASTCSCTLGCGADGTEIRTVQVAQDKGVTVTTPEGQSHDFEFDPATGAMVIGTSDSVGPAPSDFSIDTAIDTARTYRTSISLSGRPSVCKPAGSTVPLEACPSPPPP